MDWIYLAQNRSRWGFCEFGMKPGKRGKISWQAVGLSSKKGLFSVEAVSY